jgi:large conductance mechanosensitive channel
MPPIGLLLGNVDFANLFVQLNPNKVQLTEGATLQAAKEAGAVTLNYGVFISAIINFLILAIVIFFIVKAVNKIKSVGKEEEKPEEPTEKTCPFCASQIPVAATRCPLCTSHLEN